MRTAIYRAQHQSIDRASIFRDPFAEPLVGESRFSEAERIEKTTSSRLFMAARARLAEDLLAASGARRYIVLGAGLDTFALRNPDPELEVIEIDHPDTQAAKRARYSELGWAPRVTYASIDFERQDLSDVLALPPKPTFASWLGVTYYLEPAATLQTLRALASHQISVVFDYGIPGDRFADVAARTAAIGEPLKGSFTIEACVEAARTAGFAQSHDYDGGELIARYLGRIPSGIPSFARMLHAVARDAGAPRTVTSG